MKHSHQFKLKVLAWDDANGKDSGKTAAHFGVKRNSVRTWRYRRAHCLRQFAADRADAEWSRKKTPTTPLPERISIIEAHIASGDTLCALASANGLTISGARGWVRDIDKFKSLRGHRERREQERADRRELPATFVEIAEVLAEMAASCATAERAAFIAAKWASVPKCLYCGGPSYAMNRGAVTPSRTSTFCTQRCYQSHRSAAHAFRNTARDAHQRFAEDMAAWPQVYRARAARVRSLLVGWIESTPPDWIRSPASRAYAQHIRVLKRRAYARARYARNPSVRRKDRLRQAVQKYGEYGPAYVAMLELNDDLRERRNFAANEERGPTWKRTNRQRERLKNVSGSRCRVFKRDACPPKPPTP